jgi:hypothetical protein
MIEHNISVYASALERIKFSDEHTFAHLYFDKIWRVTKTGTPNCVMRSISSIRDRVLVDVRGLTRLKVGLEVKSGDYLTVQDGGMQLAHPGVSFPLVRVLENGVVGQVVWVVLLG